MPGFNFLFEAFILLMGLAMAEVLQGFARVLKLRARRKAGIDPQASAIRIGWLTPLLGLLVLTDQATFFLHMYGIRDFVLFNMGSVLAILVLIGWFYLISSLVFPDEPRDWPDFDRWYRQQKRWIVGGVLGINLLAFALTSAITPMEYAQEVAAQASPLFGIAALLSLTVFPALVWLLFSKRPRVDLALIGYILFATFAFAILTIGEVQPG